MLLADGSGSSGDALHQPVHELESLIESAHRNALVHAVRKRLRIEHSGNAVHRNPGVAEAEAIRGARAHRRNHRHAGPHLLRHALDLTHERRRERRGRRVRRRPLERDLYPRVADDALQDALLTRTFEEWEAILLPAGVPVGAINTLDAVVDHPQVAARGALVECDHPVAGRIRMVGPPVRMSETPGAVRTPAPLLGEHTEEVLRARLGLDAEEIARLRRERVIA